MELSLAQENRCTNDYVQNSNPSSENSGGGKRNSLKKWLHEAVMGYDVDDSFNNEDTVIIADNNIAFIPNLSDMSNEWFSSNKEIAPLLIGEKQGHKNHHRQKLKDIKLYLKMKMHLSKGDENGIINGIVPCEGENSVEQENRDDSYRNNDEEVLECYQKFKTQPEHLDALFDSTMKNASDPESPLYASGFNYADSPVKEMQPFQNLNYNDIKSIVEPMACSPLDAWDVDKAITSKFSNSSSPDGPGGSSSNSNDSKGEEDCPTLSMDSTDMESPTTGDSTERSIELTPSVYLANELTTKEVIAGNDTNNNSFNSSGEVGETSFEDSQDTQNTLCSSESSDLSSSSDSESNTDSASGNSNTIIYAIPTFKQRRGQLNVSGIIRSFRDGTLTEKNLAKMAKGNPIGLSFRSKEFYDQPPSSAEDVEEQDSKQITPCIPSGNENDNVSENDKFEFTGDGECVKFDNYSQILVYKAAKRNVRDRGTNYSTLRTSNDENRITTSRVDQPLYASRSILKRADNERESEEIMRATLCDKVDVKSFLAYFEYFEHQKHSEEPNLSKVREQQLSHYYSKEFFPELLEDIKFKRAFNGEYRKSKLATELNIGRKIGKSNEQCARSLTSVIKDPMLGTKQS